MQCLDSISFDDASAIVDRHWRRFFEPGVVGFGVADRADRICFIVKVKDGNVRSRLAAEYRDSAVEGLPVYVELQDRVPLADTVDTAHAEGHRIYSPRNVLQAVVDRPGFLILAAIVTAVAVFAFRG